MKTSLIFVSVTEKQNSSTSLRSKSSRDDKVPGERSTQKIPLSVKLDKGRLIAGKQAAKINLERCNKMKEEFQQPEGRRKDIKFPKRGKLRQDKHMDFER